MLTDTPCRLQTARFQSRHGICRLLRLALLLPASALAGSAGWSEYASVAELTPTSHHRYEVRLNLADNPSGCRSKDSFYQDYATSGAELMYRTLLQALTSGKRVRVFTTGRCELNGYGEISSLSILP